jgi:hypothetical protein
MNTDRLVRLGLVAVVLLVAACASPGASAPSATGASASPAQTTTSSSSGAASAVPTGLLAIVEQRGGECPAATCETTIYLDADGRIHMAAKPPNDLGTATPAQIQALEAAIASTDFSNVRKPAFSGECPTAYDGQELVFTFTTAAGAERLASCESALDYSTPLFKALADALGTASPFKAVK